MTIVPKYLSNSISGIPIVVGGTTINAGTLIHTAVNVANSMDNIHLTISNTASTQQTCVLEWGSTGNQQMYTVSPSGVASVPFQFLSGGLSISAFSQSASALTISGRCYTESP